MNPPESMSRQRAHQADLRSATKEANLALQPLHDALLEESDAFDGIVYFARDTWHRGNASAVATVQPTSADHERFAFYRDNIAGHRVDLAATALGLALQDPEPQYRRSRMNPTKHTTWASPVFIDHRSVGGAQAAFNGTFGTPPSDEKMQTIWDHHTPVIREVGGLFHDVAKTVESVGDTLELLAPVTPNAYIMSWDLTDSTGLALGEKYGALRNYLLDVKGTFHDLMGTRDFHDTGDGQDALLWLPDGVDRADEAAVKQFGVDVVMPLMNDFAVAQQRLAKGYDDISPSIRIAIGLGYVEKDAYNEHTSAEFWQIGKLHKTKGSQKVYLTPNAQKILRTS